VTFLIFERPPEKKKKMQILTDTFADGGPTQRAITFE
jgi:hypothetical protein